MSNKHTSVKARNRDQALEVSHSTTDSPLIPVAQLEKLHQFRPDAVDWVFAETEKEAVARRSETHRVNTMIFIERIVGQIFGLLIGVAGLGAAAYLGTHGSETASAVIGGTALVSLVTAFIVGRVGGKKTPAQ